MSLDNKKRELVELLQSSFPLAARPYNDIGSALGIDEQEVIDLIAGLKTEGIIRQVGPVFDAKRLGYKTTLAAMEVAQDRLEEAAQVILGHPGISHGYMRDNRFNLWITLATSKDIDTELSRLAGRVGADNYFSLPVVRFFKLRTLFNIGEGKKAEAASEYSAEKCHIREEVLSPLDRKIINEIQQDLALLSRPFAMMSAKLGLDEDEFLSQCRSLIRCGVMRRFGAAINHHKAGYTANAMTCWQVPGDKVEEIGQALSAKPEVSHCYERRTNPLWQYNVFAMIHGHSEDECRHVAAAACSETGLYDYVMLFSTREIKKVRVKYPV